MSSPSHDRECRLNERRVRMTGGTLCATKEEADVFHAISARAVESALTRLPLFSGIRLFREESNNWVRSEEVDANIRQNINRQFSCLWIFGAI